MLAVTLILLENEAVWQFSKRVAQTGLTDFAIICENKESVCIDSIPHPAALVNYM